MAIRIPGGGVEEGAALLTKLDKLKGLGSVADDAFIYAMRKANPSLVPDGQDGAALGKISHRHSGRRKGNPDIADGSDVSPRNKPLPKTNPDIFAGVDRVVDGAGNALQMLMPLQIATDVVPLVLGTGAGLVGLKGTQAILKKPAEFMYGVHDEKTGALTKKAGITLGSWSIGRVLQDGSMLGFQAISSYGVARGFFQKMDALKQMYADMTGQDIKKISTWDLVTGSKKLPALVAEARQHIIKEHGIRGLVQALGWGLMLRDLKKSGNISLLSFLVPAAAGAGADILMGESPILHVYKGVSDAFKTGEVLPPEAYAEFLAAASADIRKRGALGKQVAIEVGKQYAAEKISPADILKEVEASLSAHKEGKTGKLDDRVASVIKTAEAAYAAQAKAHQAARAAAKEPVHAKAANETKTGATKPQKKFVDKLMEERATQFSSDHAGAAVIP